MSPATEKRLLQATVVIACIVPLATGALSVARGPGSIGHAAGVPVDLDSHFRYLSGILFAIGLAFLSCVPRIEAKGARFRLLGALVIAGGAARLVSLAAVGMPSKGHVFGLAMELGVVPLLLLWQRGLEGRSLPAK